MRGQFYSLLSGSLAAIASLCGKLAFGKDEAFLLCEFLHNFMWAPELIAIKLPNVVCINISFYIRIAFFASMFLVNAVMWTTFVKALRFSATSLEATVTNTAANFFFTAIFGQVFFSENLTLMWWLGTVLILFGLLLMHKGNQTIADKKKKRHKLT